MCSKFRDVNIYTQGCKEIMLCTRLNLMGGNHMGNFSSDSCITLGEILKIFAYITNYGFCPILTENIEVPPSINNSWAKDYYIFCKQHDIITDDIYVSDLFDVAISRDIQIMMQNYAKFEPDFRCDFDTIPGFYPLDTPITRRCLAMALGHAYQNLIAAKSKELDAAMKNNDVKTVAKILRVWSNCSCLFPEEYAEYSVALSKIGDKYSEKYNEQHIECALENMLAIKRLFQAVFCVNEDLKEIHQYTSLEALENLSKGSKLRLSNAIYLNDPREGKDLEDILKEIEVNNGDLEKMHPDSSNISKCYIVSFNQNPTEEIPMWWQYAREGTGCRITYPCYSIKQPLYHVIYDKEKIEDFLQKLLKLYHTAVEQCPQIEKGLLQYISRVLTKVSFLYKNESYRHENEVRLIRFVEPFEAIEAQDVRAGEYFPRLYTEVVDNMEIGSVLIGPRVPQYIYQHIKLVMSARSSCDVNYSSIHIR